MNEVKQLEQSVEEQISTSGLFSPIEWLVTAGYLSYSEAEVLQQQADCDLESLLGEAADSKTLRDRLAVCVRYAKKRGLSEQPADERMYSLSQDRELNTLLNYVWERESQDTPQLDIFADNRSVMLSNDICIALAQHQRERAQHLIDQLYKEDSQHKYLRHYDDLLGYSHYIVTPLEADIEALEEEVLGLQEEIFPAAQSCMRQHLRRYFVPAWQRIADAAKGSAWEIGNSLVTHPSYALMQLPNWQGVSDSVLATVQFTHSAELIQRLAIAQLMQAQTQKEQRFNYFITWCLLFCLHPEQAPDLLEKQSPIDYALKNHWQRYEDLEWEEPGYVFAGYVLIQEQGLAHYVDKHPLRELFLQQKELSLVYQLIQARQQGADEAGLRQQLQQASQTLLTLYLQRVG